MPLLPAARLLSGQSNMQYTPRSMAGMNNMSAELAAADGYGDTIRLFTAGMESVCGTPGSASGRALPRADCTKPWRELNPNISVTNWTQDGSEAQYINGSWMNETCGNGHACRQPWAQASSVALGAQAWNTFSAVCWLFGRDVHDALGGKVPVGLISSNWGGTPVESWLPESAAKSCSRNAQGGSLYNTMIAPFTVGPMALNGFTWYQGESNIGSGADKGKNAQSYSCNFPAMVTGWRTEFNDSALFFGFVQVAGFGYAGTVNCSDGTAHACPDTAHSLAAGDLRQAQLAALKLHNVGFSTTVDTGDYANIHPPDKQTPSRRLANQALRILYKQQGVEGEFPFYASQSLAISKSTTGAATATVTVAIRTGRPGAQSKVELTMNAPLAATQSTTLGTGIWLPRNKCVTSVAEGFGHGMKVFPEFCGYPTIFGIAANGTTLSLNASATIGSDGSSIVISATMPPGDFNVTGTSYGRATWPLTVFFSKAGLPVVPWFASLSATDPWTSPGWYGPENQVAG
jgi:hypothetical protein